MPTVTLALGDARMFPVWRAGGREDRLQLLRLGDTLRLLIADDHETIRKGVRSILAHRSDIEVCGEATNGREAIDQAIELKPDLIILDINMPVLSGFVAAQEIKRLMPEVPILLFSVHDSRRMVEEAKAIGIQGFVSKDQAGAVLLKAIDALCSKISFFPC